MCLLHATDDPALTASAILHLLSALGRRDEMSSRVRVGREVKPHIATSVSLPSNMEAIGSALWQYRRLVLNKPYSWEQIGANRGLFGGGNGQNGSRSSHPAPRAFLETQGEGGRAETNHGI